MSVLERTKTASAMATEMARSTLNSAKETMDPRKIAMAFVSIWAISVLTFFTFVKQMVEPVYRFLFASRHPIVVRTPEDRFVAIGLDGLGYTFASNYIDVPLGAGKAIGRPRLHYLDEYAHDVKENAQETILCLHGEPSWSFTYRKMIPVLVRAGYRVVVPDMIGFGKSDKYVDMDNYNHEMHTFAVKHLIDELGLGNNITLVAQGLGGIIGLSVVKDVPDRFSNLVLMNAMLPTGFDDELFRKNPIRNIVGVLPFMLWRSIVSLFGTGFPIEFLFRRVVGISGSEAKAYGAPFPDSTYKGGVAKWPLLVPVFRDDPVAQHMVEAKGCLRAWQKPALLVWGGKDQITKLWQPDFVALLTRAKKVTIKGAGHFLEETHGGEVAENIVSFLEKKL